MAAPPLGALARLWPVASLHDQLGRAASFDGTDWQDHHRHTTDTTTETTAKHHREGTSVSDESAHVIAEPGTDRRRRRVTGVLALAATGMLVLAGCAAGQRAHTAEEVPAGVGGSGSIGNLRLLNVNVAAPPNRSYPQGSDADLQLHIANDGSSPDKLTSVTTNIASSVTFYSAGAGAGSSASGSGTSANGSTSPSGSSTPSPSPTGSAAPRASGSPTASMSPSANPSAGSGSPSSPSVPTTGSVSSIDVPTGQAVAIGYTSTEAAIVLKGLTGQLWPAQAINITFQFANAGSVTVDVPVQLAPLPPSPATAPVSG